MAQTLLAAHPFAPRSHSRAPNPCLVPVNMSSTRELQGRRGSGLLAKSAGLAVGLGALWGGSKMVRMVRTRAYKKPERAPSAAPLSLPMPIPPTWIDGSVGLLAKGAECVQHNFGPWSLHDLTLGLAVMAKVTEKQQQGAPGEVIEPDYDELREAQFWRTHAEAAYCGDNATWSLQTGQPESSIIGSRWEPDNRRLRPAYVVSINRERRQIIVSVRGTSDPGDMLTNAALHCEELMGGSVHAGFLHATQNLLEDISPLIIRGVRALLFSMAKSWQSEDDGGEQGWMGDPGPRGEPKGAKDPTKASTARPQEELQGGCDPSLSGPEEAGGNEATDSGGVGSGKGERDRLSDGSSRGQASAATESGAMKGGANRPLSSHAEGSHEDGSGGAGGNGAGAGAGTANAGGGGAKQKISITFVGHSLGAAVSVLAGLILTDPEAALPDGGPNSPSNNDKGGAVPDGGADPIGRNSDGVAMPEGRPRPSSNDEPGLDRPLRRPKAPSRNHEAEAALQASSDATSAMVSGSGASDETDAADAVHATCYPTNCEGTRATDKVDRGSEKSGLLGKGDGVAKAGACSTVNGHEVPGAEDLDADRLIQPEAEGGGDRFGERRDSGGALGKDEETEDEEGSTKDPPQVVVAKESLTLNDRLAAENAYLGVKCWGFGPPAFLTLDLAEKCAPFTTCVLSNYDLVPRFSVASVERLRRRISSYDWDEAERVLGGDADEDWRNLKATKEFWSKISRFGEKLPALLPSLGEIVEVKVHEAQQALGGVVGGWVGGKGSESEGSESFSEEERAEGGGKGEAGGRRRRAPEGEQGPNKSGKVGNADTDKDLPKDPSIREGEGGWQGVQLGLEGVEGKEPAALIAESLVHDATLATQAQPGGGGIFWTMEAAGGAAPDDGESLPRALPHRAAGEGGAKDLQLEPLQALEVGEEGPADLAPSRDPAGSLPQKAPLASAGRHGSGKRPITTSLLDAARNESTQTGERDHGAELRTSNPGGGEQVEDQMAEPGSSPLRGAQGAEDEVVNRVLLVTESRTVSDVGRGDVSKATDDISKTEGFHVGERVLVMSEVAAPVLVDGESSAGAAWGMLHFEKEEGPKAPFGPRVPNTGALEEPMASFRPAAVESDVLQGPNAPFKPKALEAGAFGGPEPSLGPRAAEVRASEGPKAPLNVTDGDGSSSWQWLGLDEVGKSKSLADRQEINTKEAEEGNGSEKGKGVLSREQNGGGRPGGPPAADVSRDGDDISMGSADGTEQEEQTESEGGGEAGPKCPALYPPSRLLVLTSFPPGCGKEPASRKQAPDQRKYGTFPTFEEVHGVTWALSEARPEDLGEILVTRWCISDHMPSTLNEGLAFLLGKCPPE